MPRTSRWTGPRDRLLVVVQIGLTVLVILGPHAPGGAEAWPAPWGTGAKVVGIFLGVCGGLLALAGALRMGSNLTPSPRPRDGAPLLVGGAYGLVRHPMYGGLALAAFGWAFFVNGPLTFLYACVLVVWLDFKTRREERLLEAAHPDYAEYRTRVRKLIPFVY